MHGVESFERLYQSFSQDLMGGRWVLDYVVRAFRVLLNTPFLSIHIINHTMPNHNTVCTKYIAPPYLCTTTVAKDYVSFVKLVSDTPYKLYNHAMDDGSAMPS